MATQKTNSTQILTLAALFFIVLVSSGAGAIPIAGTPLDLSWGVNYNAGAGLFEYRYNIANTGAANIVDGARWTVAEDRVTGHAGLHHEQNFLNDGGLFQFDRVKAGFPAHNYDWRDLDIPAGNSITIGFDDEHAPRMEMWEIENGAISFDQAFPGVPVPALNPLGEVVLDLGGGDFKAAGVWSVAEPRAAAAGGGWCYKYFLVNTGNVPIGPDPVPPPPIDNHADYYVNEHPTHAGIHHEAFIPLCGPDNAMATAFGLEPATPLPHIDALGVADPIPPGIAFHHYGWQDLGDGALGPWLPGQVLTLGFFDPHGPGTSPWALQIFGSSAEEFFDDPAQMVPVPVAEAPEPSIAWLFVIGITGISASRLSQLKAGRRKKA